MIKTGKPGNALETACFRASLRAKGRKRVRVNPNLSDEHCFGGFGIGSLVQTLQKKEWVIHMKKEYQKPLVACKDIRTKEIISNSQEYKQRVLHQDWMRQAEKRGISVTGIVQQIQMA